MKTSEVLRQARKLIEKPEHWTQGANARKANGLLCSVDATDAVCFCLNGAIHRRMRLGDYSSCGSACGALCRVAGGSFIEFNDAPGRAHAEVLDLLDRTIAAEEVRERLAAGEPLHRIEAGLDLRDNLPQN
jgi:hypothetical protein